MLDETKVIELKDFFKHDERVEMLKAHARTMMLMFSATKDAKYLVRARTDINKANAILRGNYPKPLGVLTKVA